MEIAYCRRLDRFGAGGEKFFVGWPKNIAPPLNWGWSLCQADFGEYFHHFPYFGMRSDDDEVELKSAFDETCDLYRTEFKENLLRAAGAQKCWYDGKERCWHACKSD